MSTNNASFGVLFQYPLRWVAVLLVIASLALPLLSEPQSSNYDSLPQLTGGSVDAGAGG